MPNTYDLYKGFEEYQRYRGLSTRTIRRRSYSLGAFKQFLHPLPPQQATPELIEEWLSTFPVATTRYAYRADLGAFYKWAVKRRVIVDNPMIDVDPIKVPKGLPHPIDPALIPDLVRYAPDRETELAVALAAYAGLRCFEVANLRRDDISLHAAPPVLIVRNGKGGKDRVVPIHPALAVVLRGLPAGKVCPHEVDTIGRKVARYLRDAGLDATMHHLRHTFGTEAGRASNGNVLVVRELLGHESPETSLRYTALSPKLAAATVSDMFSPPPVERSA
jgi:integrase/recombinase XerC